jgi:DNA-binding transcriptional LysR family regulator
MNMNVTVKQLRAFLAVARLGSFTRASGVLHATQSSLSVLVRELETELAIKILDRTTRKVELTEAGEQFYQDAAGVLAGLEQAIQKTRNLSIMKGGHVSIAATPLCAAAFLPRAVAAFRAKYPDVEVALTDMRVEQIAAAVSDRQFSCGVGVFGPEKGVVATPLLEPRLMLACPRAHAFARRKKVNWKDLDGQTLITVRGNNIVRREFDRCVHQAGVEPQKIIEVQQMMTALGLVDAGFGLAVWPAWAASVASLYAVALIPLDRPALTHPLSVIVAEGRSPSAATQAFIQALQDYVRVHRSYFAHVKGQRKVAIVDRQ